MCNKATGSKKTMREVVDIIIMHEFTHGNNAVMGEKNKTRGRERNKNNVPYVELTKHILVCLWFSKSLTNHHNPQFVSG